MQTFEEITTGKAPETNERPPVTYKSLDKSDSKGGKADKDKAGKPEVKEKTDDANADALLTLSESSMKAGMKSKVFKIYKEILGNTPTPPQQRKLDKH